MLDLFVLFVVPEKSRTLVSGTPGIFEMPLGMPSKKKKSEKETLVPYRGKRVKKSPFLAHQKGDIFLFL